jgi:hypothetical protein
VQVIRSTDLATLTAQGAIVSGVSYVVHDWPGSQLVGTNAGLLAGRVGTFGSPQSLPSPDIFASGSRAWLKSGGEAVADGASWHIVLTGTDPIVSGSKLQLPVVVREPSSGFGAEDAQDAVAQALLAGSHDGVDVAYDDAGGKLTLSTGIRTFQAGAYDASGRITSFASNGVAFAVAYPLPTQIVVSGGGKTRTIVSDSTGKLTSVTTS